MATIARTSWFNRIYLTLLLAGAATCAATGQIASALALLVALVVGAWCVRRSLYGGSDEFHVGAAQPMDEREQQATLWSFALVGMFAIMMETVAFIAELARGNAGGDAWWHFVALGIAWATANLLAVRRV